MKHFKEKLITDITKLALDFWTMNLHNGTFESNLRTLIDKHEEAINYSQCCETLPCSYAEGYNDAIAKIKEEAKYIEKQ